MELKSKDKILKVMTGKSLIQDPVYKCYFCEKAVNEKGKEKQFDSFKGVDWRHLDDTIPICYYCHEKYLLLIQYQGIEVIQKHLENIKEDRMIKCSVCEKQFLEGQGQITSERMGISLYYYCNKCIKMDETDRKMFAKINSDKQRQDMFIKDFHQNN